MKTWTLKIDEDELKALIMHHVNRMFSDQSVERSSRIHDLTKRLNKDAPEIEQVENAQQQTKDGW